MNDPASLTGQYLTGERGIAIPERRAATRAAPSSSSGRAATTSRTSPRDPLGLFTCVSGVSGGGKSTLLIDTLYKRWRAASMAPRRPCPVRQDRGLEHIDKIIDIDQSPIGRPRAAIQRPIRAPSRRSANGSPACRNRARAATSRPLLVQRQGRTLRGLPGRRRDQDRDALPADVYVTCDVCKGKRYNRETSRSPSRASRSPTCST